VKPLHYFYCMKAMICFITVLFFLSSCSGGNNYPAAENDFDAGREFIDGCLKGDFAKALFYMSQDSVNIKLLENLKKEYDADNATLKQQYKDASIIIDQDETIDPATHIIYYKNSYDKIAHKVKVLNENGTWLVDLKYTFNGNL
jgi:hypothetical protein